MIFLLALLLSSAAHAENYIGKPEVASDLDTTYFSRPLRLDWKGDAFAGVPGFSAPRPRVPEELKLQATMPGDGSSLAVVNDRVVSAGEKIGSRKVRKIGDGYILLEKAGSVTELALEEKTSAPAGAPAASPELARGLASMPGLPEGTIQIEERPSK